MSELSWQEAKDFVERLIFQATNKYLSEIEIAILKGAWDNQTYESIANNTGYSIGYLNKDVGNKLWEKLAKVLGEDISKKNFREPLKRKWQQGNIIISNPNQQLESAIIPFPEGSVSLDSPLYIERDRVESECYQEIVKPGSLIRIKAPHLMGKTSLLNRILDYTKHQNYKTVYFNFNAIEQKKLTNLEELLRLFCFTAGRQIKIDNKLNEYWDTEFLGSNDNCTVYFEEYLLPTINCPLVLVLDDVDRLFPVSEVIADFFGMLRSWHEKGKISPVWKQVRIVIAHSTEVYITLDLNQSPFNAGVPVELQEFDSKQVKKLARLHQLDWDNTQIEKLMEMVGGHPYLVSLALYHLSKNQVNLEHFLKEAITESGIYSNHLRGHLQIIKNVPELAEAYKQVVTSAETVELDSKQIWQLHSRGLVQRRDNHVTPRCNLYRQYFARVL